VTSRASLLRSASRWRRSTARQVDEIPRNADTALYRSKSSGRGSFTFYGDNCDG
jgi:hypothetical protein